MRRTWLAFVRADTENGKTGGVLWRQIPYRGLPAVQLRQLQHRYRWHRNAVSAPEAERVHRQRPALGPGPSVRRRPYLPPYEQAKGTDWYKGTANAIYQNISFIDSYDPEYVIILSGDQICKQDYADFLRFHKEKGAEFSVAVMEVDWKEASRFGLMVADEDDKITEFQEKPPVPKSNLASMGIYIFNWDILKKYLEEDEADPNSKNDFGMNIIPALLRDGRKMYAYHFNGYWRDVGTIDSLWEANMEVLDPENSGIDIFDEKWKIYSRNPVLPAQKIGPPRCRAGFAGH